MSEIKENPQGDSIEVEIEGVQAKSDAPQAIPENPTRLIGVDVDPGPQLPQINQETLPNPALGQEADQGTATTPDFQPLPETPIAETAAVPSLETNADLGQNEAVAQSSVASESVVASEQVDPIATPEQGNPVAALEQDIPVVTPEQAEKKHWDIKDIESATNLSELMEAYLEASKENYFNLAKLLDMQKMMAEKLLKLDMPDQSLEFAKLAGETVNTLHQQNNTQHLDGVFGLFRQNLQNFSEDFEEKLRKFRNSAY